MLEAFNLFPFDDKTCAWDEGATMRAGQHGGGDDSNAIGLFEGPDGGGRLRCMHGNQQ
jgi:hypothetical protein